ncbi:MAG: Gfo/Idh/MocA family oxidoreductase [Lentisphaerae bacterium]|nr:Gfo/Idh/MocA family oxidoreductase [Lentisphaerota bacterium]
MNNPLRAVLVGCGGMAGAWLKAAKEAGGIEWAGFVDIRAEAAQKRATESGAVNPIVGTDLDAVLTAARPDVVFDCTVPEAHRPVTLAALAHGCHVLGEKPLADSMAHAREMVAAAAKAGKVYAVIQNRRYIPSIRRVQRVLASGELGDLTTVNCDFYLGPHFGGFRDQMRHVLLLDMAIHTFDQARFLSGADAVAVYCRSWNPAGSWYAHGASAVALFEMSNGIVFTYRGSWCAKGLSTSWECDWRFLGSNGSAVWDGGEKFAAQQATGTVAWTDEMRDVSWTVAEGDKTGGHAGLVREFVDCVRTGRAPETICTDNIKSLAMVFGAIESAETGRRVEIKS